TLAGKDALELLQKAPDPASAAKLTAAQITAALRRAGRRGDLAQRARDIQAALRAEHLAQPDVVAEAYAASVQAGAAVIAARNKHLIDALHAQALSALSVSPGARAYYDELRAHDAGHDDALRRVASRLVGILHGCVKTGREYDETTAWSHRAEFPQAA